MTSSAGPSGASSAITPVIPGFYPDPSICRVGETYYLATSSFEYRPAVPLFESRDLLSWTFLGNALSRPSQFPEDEGRPSTGIYAPTLRYQNERFWLVTTNVSQPKSPHLIVHASDPRGPWSEPVYTQGAHGIDPDLCWDRGDCFLTWTTSDPDDPAILQARIEPSEGRLLESPRPIWGGTGLAYPEAPHLYEIDGRWYLMIAEGGTERGHSISIARSRRIDGPFESCPGNPIFSHRSLRDPVQNTGHGDLIQMASGDWAMVYLGARPRGASPGFHVNGRETFVGRVEWRDGWPVVLNSAFEVPATSRSFVDTFGGDQLHQRWVSPGQFPSRFVSLENGYAYLSAGDGTRQPNLLLTRVTDLDWEAKISLRTKSGRARFALRMDDLHWCGLECQDGEVLAVHHTRLGRQEFGRESLPGDEIELFVAAAPIEQRFGNLGGPDEIEIGCYRGKERLTLARFDGRYLSTEVAGGFTGRMIGVAALSGIVSVARFEYSPRG